MDAGTSSTSLGCLVQGLHFARNNFPLDPEATQRYCCVMVPELIDIGGPWKVLPPGTHEASLVDVEASFATNPSRRAMFQGLVTGVEALRRAGCKVLYLDGSFVTEKDFPGDFDACWEPHGVNPLALDPVLLDFSNGRRRQKQKYRGEFFPSSSRADGTRTFLEFFRVDKYTGEAKGILRLVLT
jgi:hypothetical protein